MVDAFYPGRRLDLTNPDENLSSQNLLERDSIPTIDVAVEEVNPGSVTDREPRMVNETCNLVFLCTFPFTIVVIFGRRLTLPSSI